MRTASQQGQSTGNTASPAGGHPSPTFDGLQDSDVQDLYDAVHRLVERHAIALRRLQADAEGRLRLAQVEQQQLARFADETAYRLRYLAQAPEADPSPYRRRDLEAQQATLADRATELRAAAARLEHLIGRIGWLVSQTELSAQGLDGDGGDGEASDPWSLLMRAQLIQGQEAERSRLAREIHDGPAQALTNTLLRLQLLEGVLRTRPVEAMPELARVRATVHESLRDVRRFIFNLRPAALQEIGLVGTLRRLIADYQERTGLDVQVTLPEMMPLRPEQELVVFRVVQEALQNVNKHARASHVEIVVTRGPGAWTIVVADDGQGFDPAERTQQARVGSGLLSMRERAGIGGGSLELASAPGRGTRLLLTLPVDMPETGSPQTVPLNDPPRAQEDRS